VKFFSIRAKIFVAFGAMLLLICGLGVFSLSQFSTMAMLYRYFNPTSFPA